MNELLNGEGNRKLSSYNVLEGELQLTLLFFVYVNNAFSGKAGPAVLQWYIQRKKLDAVTLLTSFLARNGKDIANWEPVNQFYKRLKKELLHYDEIEKNGGWKCIANDGPKTYKTGDSSITIKQVKQRLQAVAAGTTADTSLSYGNELFPLIKMAQKSFSLKEDGVTNAALIKKLNVPVKQRREQLLINLERMHWVPEQPEGEFIAVNIPELRLPVFSGEKETFQL